jgi:hypothetical protein
VLLQDSCPFAHESRMLSSAEGRYITTEQELRASVMLSKVEMFL